MYAVQLKCR